MGTLNQLYITNQFGEKSICQINSANGLTHVLVEQFTYAQLNAAGTGVAVPFSTEIPEGYIVKQVYYNVLTTFVDSGTAGNADSSTLSIGLNDPEDLKAATAISAGGNAWDAGIKSGIPTNTASNMLKCTDTAAPGVTWTAGSGDATALTDGVMNVYVEVVYGSV